ncbi:hypothetical protein [Natronoglycomyces albus]|uniref:Uncharacterized protein n=1 Tax=Natronoglycomyces albus TaxID=2811108 RepID=A0A895XLQ3_9ACTN|nr:hypothetical protein [Natronoglycomyces albus]QSB04349.1 hypothetical protein JQS30_11140 [Natronoglycomyces albus]
MSNHPENPAIEDETVATEVAAAIEEVAETETNEDDELIFEVFASRCPSAT